MKLVGSYLRNILAVLVTVVVVMFVLQLIQLDRATRATRAVGEASLIAQLDEQLASRGDAIAQVLALNVAPAMARDDQAAMFDVLMPAATRERVERVLLIDLNGRIVHDATRDVTRFGDPVTTVVPDLDVTSTAVQRLMREDSYAAVVPVVAPRGAQRDLTPVIGLVYVAISRLGVSTQLAELQGRFDRIARERMRENFKTTALCALVLMLMGIALSIVAARRMARPIEELVTTTRHIAGGHYDVSLSVPRDAEIAELATAIEEMSAELSVRNQRISSMAFRDSLTDLANRPAFTEAVAHALADPAVTSAAVLFMDLDEFKRVNDTLGHEGGDLMLKALAKRLTDALAARRFPGLSYEGQTFPPAARWGGDEFSVFLAGVDSIESATRIAQDLLTELREPVSIGGMDIVSGSSIGIALYPADSDDIGTLLNLADMAMYHAKESGRERVAAYAPSMRRSGEERLLLESDLRFAIERKQMLIDYEPILDPLSETLSGLEMRLRWQHPVHGILSPSAFMPLAESIDLSATLQCWAIERALTDFSQARHIVDSDLELTINLLSDRVDEERLTETLADGLERSGLDSRRVILEVSEPRLFRNLLHTVPLLDAVRVLGVQVWVDRFGSGHAAINRLRHLHLDGMKLDATLVGATDESPADQSLAAAIVALAHSLGLRVAAEGVTSRRQLDFLRRSGCDGVQGPLFGAPGSAAEVTRSPEPTAPVKSSA